MIIYPQIYVYLVVLNVISAFKMHLIFWNICFWMANLNMYKRDCDYVTLLISIMHKKLVYYSRDLLIWLVATSLDSSEKWFKSNKFDYVTQIYWLHFSLFGLENFCRDMDFYPDDTLNSLIRWAVYAYGTETDECINANYPQYVEQLRNTVWEDTNYPGGIFFLIKPNQL